MEKNLKEVLNSVKNNYQSFTITELLDIYSKAREYVHTSNNHDSDDFKSAQAYILIIEQALEDGLSGQYDLL